MGTVTIAAAVHVMLKDKDENIEVGAQPGGLTAMETWLSRPRVGEWAPLYSKVARMCCSRSGDRDSRWDSSVPFLLTRQRHWVGEKLGWRHERIK